MTLALDDESVNESLGIGEPGDISLGGVRVRNLPICGQIRVGDRLGLLLMDQEEALSLHGEVVHHGTPDTFGVEFRELALADRRAIGGIIERLHRQIRITT